MKNWRKVLGASYDITKEEVWDGDKDVKPYVGENKEEIPNRAKFDGDLYPSQGDSAKAELDTWKKQNKQFDKNLKREQKGTEYGSPLVQDKTRAESLDDNIDNYSSLVGGKIGWRDVLADVQVEKRPDGTVKVNVDESQNQVQQPVQQEQPQEEQPKQASQEVKEWLIKKKGNLSLRGRECSTHCGVGIFNGDKELEFHKIAKQGHQWEELIAQGEWESKFDEVAKNEK